MKILKFAFVMTAMVISLISCQKDDEPKDGPKDGPKDEPKSVAGTWEGVFGHGNGTPYIFEKWEMEIGGDLSVFSSYGTLDGIGSWDQDGDEIEVHYIIDIEPFEPSGRTFKGTYNEDADEITGTWKDDDYATISGTFEMYRQ